MNHIFSCVACWHLIILWITERSVSDTSFRGLTNCGSMHVLVISCIIRFVSFKQRLVFLVVECFNLS